MGAAEKETGGLRRHADKISLGVKGAALAASLFIAAVFPDLLPRSFNHPVLFFRAYHLVWLGTSFFLIKRMIPASWKVASGKQFGRHYHASGATVPEDAREARLREYTRRMNLGALKVAVYWPRGPCLGRVLLSPCLRGRGALHHRDLLYLHGPVLHVRMVPFPLHNRQ